VKREGSFKFYVSEIRGELFLQKLGKEEIAFHLRVWIDLVFMSGGGKETGGWKVGGCCPRQFTYQAAHFYEVEHYTLGMHCAFCLVFFQPCMTLWGNEIS